MESARKDIVRNCFRKNGRRGWKRCWMSRSIKVKRHCKRKKQHHSYVGWPKQWYRTSSAKKAEQAKTPKTPRTMPSVGLPRSAKYFDTGLKMVSLERLAYVRFQRCPQNSEREQDRNGELKDGASCMRKMRLPTAGHRPGKELV